MFSLRFKSKLLNRIYRALVCPLSTPPALLFTTLALGSSPTVCLFEFRKCHILLHLQTSSNLVPNLANFYSFLWSHFTKAFQSRSLS